MLYTFLVLGRPNETSKEGQALRKNPPSPALVLVSCEVDVNEFLGWRGGGLREGG